MKINFKQTEMSLLWHALDILEADYDAMDGPKFEDKLIESIRTKLAKALKKMDLHGKKNDERGN